MADLNQKSGAANQPLGYDALHWIGNVINNVTQNGDPTFQPHAFTPYVPKNSAGVTPEAYDPNLAKVKQILSTSTPDQGLLNLPTDKQLEGPLTDDEYATLEKESSRGNDLAMQLLTAYTPKYGESGTQYMQSFAKPLVNDIKGDESLYNNLQTQQSALDNNPSAALAQVASVAQQYSGISPQAPNAQTTALMSQYGSIANNAIASTTPVMDSALKDMGDAASISLKTFPYETLVSDLLNRYAYQIESPSYPPPPLNIPGISNAIKKLFTASTGTQFGAGGITTPGTTDQTGLSTPNLAPASNPSSTGG